MTAVVGINGFGRFALHLLRYWLDRRRSARFRIGFINDDFLSLQRAHEIINTDPYVPFDDYRIEIEADTLRIRERDGTDHVIPYTNVPYADIPWVGQTDAVLECSGKVTDAALCQRYLRGGTKLVLISATSWNADQTLVYGFNHEDFDGARHRIISYGSCTVNGYVPLASYLHGRFGIVDSDVNVVHNIVMHRLPEHRTLQRKFCTLERSGPNLLPFLELERNFAVTYTVVPWGGVSMIDFRFRLEKPIDRPGIIADLQQAFAKGGRLHGLYAMDEADLGPQVHNRTPYSAVLIKEGIKVRGDNVYLQAYFDTENSVNRYHDLADYLLPRALGS